MIDDVFIVYSHPNERFRASNRERIAKFIGTHHRNRSAPSVRFPKTTKKRDIPVLRPSNTDKPAISLIPTKVVSSKISRDGFGLREDPFLVFPTKYITGVTSAMDYYIHSYAPSHFLGSEFVTLKHRKQLIRDHIRDAIQFPFMFESVLALAFANLSVLTPSRKQTQRSAWSHYGRAISLLRTTLAQGEIGDAVLISIVSIIGTNYLQNNLSAFQINLRGLRQVIALRGGLSSIAHSNLLQSTILTVESFWTYLRAQVHLITPNPLPAISFDIPSIPKTEVDSLTERMPVGFRSLYQQGRLSGSIARLIVQEAEYNNTLTFSPPTAYVHGGSVRKFSDLKMANHEAVTVGSYIQTCEELARLLASPDLTHLDFTCCVGMFINALCVAKSEQLSPIYFTQLQHHAKQLLECDLDATDPASRDLHAWVIFQVASTLVPSRTTNPIYIQDDLRFSLATKVVEAYTDYSWLEVKALLGNFICSDTCLTTFQNVWHLGLSLIN